MEKIWIRARVSALDIDTTGHITPRLEISYEAMASGPRISIPVIPGEDRCIVSKNMQIVDGKLIGCAFVELLESNGVVRFHGEALGGVKDGFVYLGCDMFTPLTREECERMAEMEKPVLDIAMTRGDIVKMSRSMDMKVDIKEAALELLPLRRFRETVRRAALEACSEAMREFEESMARREPVAIGAPVRKKEYVELS